MKDACIILKLKTMKKIISTIVLCGSFLSGFANIDNPVNNETGEERSLVLLNKPSMGTLRSNGPDYTTSAGFRFGFGAGVTVKHFIKEDAAIEGILSTGWYFGGFRATVLYELHKQVTEVDRLFWYYGAGGHVGFYDWSHPHWWGRQNYKNAWGPVLGIDGILGLEYQIQEIPFTVSLDIKPNISLLGFHGRGIFDSAFSVRYVLK
jgi:hypothetical protein